MSMIITKTPLRVSFAGGGSDYLEFSKSNVGCVVGCTVNLNVYVSLLELPRFARESYRFTYRKTESVNEISQIEHPVTRELLKLVNWETPLNIATMAQVPGNSGLGSSSSFTVGLANALHVFKHNKQASADYLAKTAIEVERNILQEPGGFQDQYHAAFGGFRSYFFDQKNVQISDSILDEEALDSLSCYFTLVSVGNPRSSSNFAKSTSRLNEDSKLNNMIAMRDIALELSRFLEIPRHAHDISSAIFYAINEGWKLKVKFDSEIAPPEVMKTIEVGKRAGAVAAKLCGAGNSGFVLFGHSPELQTHLINSFPPNYAIKCCFTSEGSKALSL